MELRSSVTFNFQLSTFNLLPVLPAFLAISIHLEAADILVPEQYPTIAAALAAAREGDTVRVRGGVHHGNLVLERRVNLLGEDGATIVGNGTGDAVLVAADRCVLRGFRILGSGSAMATSEAAIRVRGSGAVLEGNVLSGCLFGLYLERGGGATVRGNSISIRADRELGERGSGIHLFSSHENVFADDLVEDARDGIYFDHANRNTVTGCSFRGSRYGLHYMYSDENRFAGNRFSDCIAGSAIMFSQKLVFEGNWFAQNRGFSAVGLLLKDCYDSRCEGNVIADNSTGLVLDNSMRNTFRRNLVLRNDLAIHLFTSSDDNLFAENDFIENLSPLRLLGKRSTTRWSDGGRGNYWSGYQGYDLDGDGIGDIPYRVQDVFEFLAGDHPPLRFLLVSPAAAAMKAGEEAFPLFEFSAEVDGHPLMAPVEVPLDRRWQPSRPAGGRVPAVAAFLGAGALLAAAAAFGRRAGSPGKGSRIRRAEP